jgi:protein-S-isoprenylcysteine O-methyltransferase Ste14
MIRVTIIFLLFAFIHSIMASNWFKHACRDLFGETFMRVCYRALYSTISLSTVLLGFYFISRIPDEQLWTAPSWLRWPMHGIQIAGLVFGSLSFKHLDAAEFLGIRQIRRYLLSHEQAGNIEGLTEGGLVTVGVYGIVRHPLYLAGIVIFTFNPHITFNGLAVAVLADLYFLFGAFIEERRFLKLFGGEYREYRRSVPMLIPRIVHRAGR